MAGIIELTDDIMELDDLANQVASVASAIGEVATKEVFGEI